MTLTWFDYFALVGWVGNLEFKRQLSALTLSTLTETKCVLGGVSDSGGSFGLSNAISSFNLKGDLWRLTSKRIWRGRRMKEWQ